jgi:hypothetical protein
MRHRLYYLLPDLESARRSLDDMLLSRIEQRHVHFLTNGTPLPLDMPEANFLHKTDVVHGAGNGMIAGALLGMLIGAIVVFYFDISAKSSEAAIVILIAFGGLVFGGWAASMVAAAIPNTRLNAFYPEIEKGKILMIADVPARRVDEIERMMEQRHPEMHFSGEEPHIPVFP